jgi:tetratricopeptide (TPR) repeat protein
VIAGHSKEAEPLLKEVLKERPNSAEALHFLGRALLLRGSNLVDAQKYLQGAVGQDPNVAEYWLYLGWVNNEIGQQGPAADALKKALELDHELADAYWQRGVLEQKQGRTVDAISDLRTALQKRPSRFEAYATMALCLQDQSSWGEAVEAWKKAIAGNDKVAQWHYRLARIYNKNLGNHAGALQELEKAVALLEAPEQTAPTWAWEVYYLLWDELKAQNVERGIEYGQKTLKYASVDNAYAKEVKDWLAKQGARVP